ncbi:hypothetical protein CerSpe_228230 [Prunus speciosa]
MKKKTRDFVNSVEFEFVDSRIRRYQMGYIKLACPVTHVWYLKCLPSYIPKLKTVVPFNRIGMPGFDMSLSRSNMKLRIMGVFNTPK